MRVQLETVKLTDHELPRVARGLLEGLVPLGRLQVRSLPTLYRSGVRYATDDAELFCDPATTFKRQTADCANLSLWLLCELRNRGYQCGFRIALVNRRPGGGRLYHVQVRLADGRILDPSVRLGMV